jgi:hypothetical protein
MGEALRKLTEEELQQLQALGAQAQHTGDEIAQVDKQIARMLNGKQPGASGGSTGGGGGRSAGSSKSSPTYAADSIAAQEKLVQDLTSSWRNASGELRSGYIQQIVEAEAKLKEMKDQQTLLKEQAQGKLLGGNLMTSGLANESVSMSDFENQINAMIENLKINPIEIPIETTEKDVRAIAMAARTTADVVGSIGDAFNAIEDPAAKVMGIVMQSIATVAMGYAQATLAAAQTGNPWVWAAFAISGLATMLTMVSSIHSATGYATGGIVEGNTYSGDQIPAMLNAGELVLNASQQNTLAQNLQNNGSTVNVVGRLVGEDIFLSADRYARRSNRGSILTGKNL